MYVRDAKNREEVWLLDRLEELGLEDPAFRSRDYVIAVDETTHDKAGFGRIRIHPEDPEVCELDAVGVLPEWRDQGVGAHVIERLVSHGADNGFGSIYTVTSSVEYLQQFGFEPVHTGDVPPIMRERLEEAREHDTDAIVMSVKTDAFEVPDRLRDAFKQAGRQQVTQDDDPVTEEETETLREEFDIDPDEATYKYDTGS